MFHVTDEGRSAWQTGPEIQLEDNAKAADPQRCGWLYALYQPPTDPKTGKPLDATKPAGEWNHMRIVIGSDKCIHEVNDVKYFEYVLGSEDFNGRVAKSKFGRNAALREIEHRLPRAPRRPRRSFVPQHQDSSDRGDEVGLRENGCVQCSTEVAGSAQRAGKHRRLSAEHEFY
jgi:hypothetical protein